MRAWNYMNIDTEKQTANNIRNHRSQRLKRYRPAAATLSPSELRRIIAEMIG
jgi:ribosomal protein S24E